MNSSLQKIIESKRGLRRELAVRPIAEKLRMLDAMLHRTRILADTKRKRARKRDLPAR